MTAVAITSAALLAKVVDLLHAVPMEDRDTKGDIYKYMLGEIAFAGQNGPFRNCENLNRSCGMSRSLASIVSYGSFNSLPRPIFPISRIASLLRCPHNRRQWLRTNANLKKTLSQSFATLSVAPPRSEHDD